MTADHLFDTLETERQLEALLFAAAESLALADLEARLGVSADVAGALAALAERYAGRGIELQCVAGRWRFATAPDLAPSAGGAPRGGAPAVARGDGDAGGDRLPPTLHPRRDRRHPRRGDQLAARWTPCWRSAGCACAAAAARPGRPVTYATTDAFLEHFSLPALGDLPGLADMKAAGLLSLDLPPGFSVPNPATAGAPEEDALQPGDVPEFVRDFVGGGD